MGMLTDRTQSRRGMMIMSCILVPMYGSTSYVMIVSQGSGALLAMYPWGLLLGPRWFNKARQTSDGGGRVRAGDKMQGERRTEMKRVVPRAGQEGEVGGPGQTGGGGNGRENKDSNKEDDDEENDK